MKFRDLVEIHTVNYVNATLWLIRSGENAGMTSLVWLPDCFALSIKDRRLQTYQLEQLLYEFRMSGCLSPAGPENQIFEGHFDKLTVTHTEFNTWTAECGRADQIHG